jgi:hypothetical protein
VEQRKTKTYAVDGRSLTVAEWAAELGCTRAGVVSAMRAGRFEHIVRRGAVSKPQTITWEGRSKTIPQWAAELGMVTETLRSALHSGRSFDDIARNGKQYATHQLTWDGRSQSMKAWAAELGVGYRFLYDRVVRQGKTLEQVVLENETDIERTAMAKLRVAWAILEEIGPRRAAPVFEQLRGKDLPTFESAFRRVSMERCA